MAAAHVLSGLHATVVASFTIDKELADIQKKIWKSIMCPLQNFHSLCQLINHHQDV